MEGRCPCAASRAFAALAAQAGVDVAAADFPARFDAVLPSPPPHSHLPWCLFSFFFDPTRNLLSAIVLAIVLAIGLVAIRLAIRFG